MKKFTIILSCLIAMSNASVAQITLGAGDFPTPGLTVKYKVANDTSGGLTSLITLGSPGPSGVYNLSGAQPHINDSMIMKWLAPGNTPFPTQHPSSDVGTLWKAFLTFGDTTAWQWSYFKSDANGLILNGASIIMDTSYFSHLVHGPLQYFSPPLTNTLEMMSSDYALGYAYTDSIKSHILLTSPPPLVIASKVVLDVLVDGWGTLTTPYGAYSVLRVKQIRTQAEAFIPPADTNTNFDYDEISISYQYAFYAKGIGSTLAVVEMDPTFSEVWAVKYATTPPAGIPEAVNASGFCVLPSVTTGMIKITGWPIKEEARIVVTDAVGKQLLTTKAQAGRDLTLDVSELPEGIYLVSCYYSGGVISSRFVKSR